MPNQDRFHEYAAAIKRIELQLTEPIVPSKTFRLYFHHADIKRWNLEKLKDMVWHYARMKNKFRFN